MITATLSPIYLNLLLLMVTIPCLGLQRLIIQASKVLGGAALHHILFVVFFFVLDLIFDCVFLFDFNFLFPQMLIHILFYIKPGCSSELSGVVTAEAQLIQIKVCIAFHSLNANISFPCNILDINMFLTDFLKLLFLVFITTYA